MPGWAAALLVAGVVLAIGTAAGLIGWTMRQAGLNRGLLQLACRQYPITNNLRP